MSAYLFAVAFERLLTVCLEEEQLLVGFFGKEYTEYRDKTRVGIPGIP